MNAAPIARLCVPAGTAAACVVSAEPLDDPALEARRFARFADLAPTEQAARIEALARDGVYTELPGQLLVLRVIAGGVRHHAAVVALSRTATSDRHETSARPIALLALEARREQLLEALQAETRQRPVFHGTTAEGVTYSGFAAADPAEILVALHDGLPQDAPDAAIATVFADATVAIPEGLLVALGRA
jgi:hypothetical protein